MSEVTPFDRVDAVVVGAGPAGLEAAAALASGGVDVLVLERFPDPGDNSVCGEMIPSPRSAREVYGPDPPLDDVYSEFRGEILLNETRYLDVRVGRKAYLIPFESWVIDRSAFLREMAERALEAGARLITRAPVLGVAMREGVEVSFSSRGSTHLLSAGWLLAADGIPSTVARGIGRPPLPRNPADFALAVNVRVEGSMYPEDSVLMDFRPGVAPGGYAWIIPRGGGSANVGLGVRASELDRVDVVEALAGYIRSSPFLKVAKIVGDVRGKLIPVSGLRRDLQIGKVLFVGDSAWTCHPVNGGGIVPAMVSGRLAAEAVVTGSDYSSLLEGRLGRMLRTALAYRRLADRFLFRRGLATLFSLLLTRGLVERAILSKGGLLSRLVELAAAPGPTGRGST